MRPAKRPDETWETYMERLGTWECTPEGLDFLAKQKLAQLAEVEEAHAALRRRVLVASRIPERYWFMAVESPHETDAVKALQNGVQGLMVLSGGVGCGKTAAACWWLGQVSGSQFITAGKMSRISKWGDEVREILRAQRLVIDDLGVEFADEKGFFFSLLDDVLNERYAANRPTVITTNLKAEIFSPRYKGRIVDRINEFDGFVSIAGGSLRGAKQMGLLPASAVHQ